MTECKMTEWRRSVVARRISRVANDASPMHYMSTQGEWAASSRWDGTLDMTTNSGNSGRSGIACQGPKSMGATALAAGMQAWAARQRA